jgi:hypothetical protein
VKAWWGVTPPPRDYWDSPWRYGRGMPGDWYYERRTYPVAPVPAPRPVDEERIRKIVREEIANLPIPFDVPDAPPEQP